MMTRRALLILLWVGVVPFAARPQSMTKVPHIAVVGQGLAATNAAWIDAFRFGLRELGYVEGGNIRIEVSFSDAKLGRLAEFAADVVRGNPDVIVAFPTTTVLELRKYTRTIPIVIALGAGVVETGLVASLARPGGNVTGLTHQGDEVTQKQLEVLKAVSPHATRVGVLTTGTGAIHQKVWEATVRAARLLDLTLIELRIHSPADLDQAGTRCKTERCDALMALLDPLFPSWRVQIVGAVARMRLPAVYTDAEFVRAGGLIGYGADRRDMFRRAAGYVDKILKGAKPADLPIEQPTKFDLIVNLNTAKKLGLAIPDAVLLRADEVIR